MDNKYYTPDINEFHVGFEYEIENIEDDNWLKFIFPEPYVCNKRDGEVDLVELFYSNLKESRVKYLNKDDIDSITKQYNLVRTDTHISRTRDCWSYNFNSSFEIYVSFETRTVQIYTIYPDTDNKNCRFNGELKNKSELINQLKRCKILNDK